MEVGKNSVVYYTDEGYIVTVTGGWFDERLGEKYNHIVVPYAKPSSMYVLDGEIMDKQDWTPLVQGNSIVNIPETSRVHVEGQKLKVTDGILELDKHPLRKVQVYIDSVTHLSKEVIL